jgi:hypothetical protein
MEDSRDMAQIIFFTRSVSDVDHPEHGTSKQTTISDPTLLI